MEERTKGCGRKGSGRGSGIMSPGGPAEKGEDSVKDDSIIEAVEVRGDRVASYKTFGRTS